MTYPAVMGERATLDLVLAGRSLARYGDGEFNICAAGHAKKQGYHWRLMDRLQEILKDSGDCMVGIPNLRSETPKARFWSKYEVSTLFLSQRHYASAFVTRPDSAPWIDTPEYWAVVESLWTGRAVTLVRGGELSLTAADLGANVREIIAPSRDAWSNYDALLTRIGTPERVLLCLGPTATVLAVDLCAKGVHAIDLGHVGMFLRKHRNGQPMTVTAADKAAA